MGSNAYLRGNIGSASSPRKQELKRVLKPIPRPVFGNRHYFDLDVALLIWGCYRDNYTFGEDRLIDIDHLQ